VLGRSCVRHRRLIAAVQWRCDHRAQLFALHLGTVDMKSHIENCKQWLRQRLLQIRQRMPNSEIELSDSTSADHHAEDVMIAKVVVPELKFRDVEWHIFGAEAVEGTKDATLEY